MIYFSLTLFSYISMLFIIGPLTGLAARLPGTLEPYAIG